MHCKATATPFLTIHCSENSFNLSQHHCYAILHTVNHRNSITLTINRSAINCNPPQYHCYTIHHHPVLHTVNHRNNQTLTIHRRTIIWNLPQRHLGRKRRSSRYSLPTIFLFWWDRSSRCPANILQSDNKQDRKLEQKHRQQHEHETQQPQQFFVSALLRRSSPYHTDILQFPFDSPPSSAKLQSLSVDCRLTPHSCIACKFNITQKIMGKCQFF